MGLKPLNVTQLNRYIKRILQTDPILADITVTGEISNLVLHGSGHAYFALKDETSRVRCFLPSDRLQRLRYAISDGMQVVVSGNVSVYERGGTYSLNIQQLDPVGEGALFLAFENLKRKLELEGLFDEERKRPVPSDAASVGVVTSPTGAAVRDIISAIRRRNPLVAIRIYPCLVQGEEAAASIVRALEAAEAHREHLDVLIVGRGGGSLEDLWAFNEEVVARAIARCTIPVISAVGHESDVVISDFVADLRASTPTAAAEQSVFDASEIRRFLQQYDAMWMHRTALEQIGRRLEVVTRLRTESDELIEARMRRAEEELELAAVKIRLLDPMNVIRRGYAAVQSKTGVWKTDARQLSLKERVVLVLRDGRAECTVEEVTGDHG